MYYVIGKNISQEMLDNIRKEVNDEITVVESVEQIPPQDRGMKNRTEIFKITAPPPMPELDTVFFDDRKPKYHNPYSKKNHFKQVKQ